jgi:prophage antirepressor-like protein
VEEIKCDIVLFSDNKLNSESANTIFINESGLYSLILRSNKKEALAFKKWITSDILPSIRKTGSYSVFDYTPYSNKNVFYLFRVKDKIYKFGITKNIKNRFNMHKTNKLLLT